MQRFARLAITAALLLAGLGTLLFVTPWVDCRPVDELPASAGVAPPGTRCFTDRSGQLAFHRHGLPSEEPVRFLAQLIGTLLLVAIIRAAILTRGWRPGDPVAVAALFESLRADFPHLHMKINRAPQNVDLEMNIPAQEGLLFAVNVTLQGDELHLEAGWLHLDWFPCVSSEVSDPFRQVVAGLLSGQLRIVEHYRGNRAVKAELQEPAESGWETIGITRHGMSLLSPQTTRILQNMGGS